MRRVLPGLLMAALWLLLLQAAPSWLFALVISLLALLGAREYFALTGLNRQMPAGFALALVMLPLAAAWSGQAGTVLLALFAAIIGAAILIQLRYRSLAEPAATLMALNFGTCYVGVCLGSLLLLEALPHGRLWILLLTVVTAASDTGAYYAGRAWGRTKLCPHISPGKTREGALGGIVAAVVAVVGLGQWLLPQYPSLSLAATALLLAVTGIVGDLLESLLKRAYGIKDSGTLLAGHGGILDRGDSLLLAAPLLYILLSLDLLSP